MISTGSSRDTENKKVSDKAGIGIKNWMFCIEVKRVGYKYLIILIICIPCLLIVCIQASYLNEIQLSTFFLPSSFVNGDARLSKEDKERIDKRDFLLKKYKQKCYISEENGRKDQHPSLTPDSECSAPYITVNDGGRIGNNICEYISLWVFRNDFGVRTIITDAMHRNLNEMFEKLSILNQNSSKCLRIHKSPSYVGMDFSRMYEAFNNTVNRLNARQPSPFPNRRFHLTKYPCAIEYLLHKRVQIREELRIRKESVEIVERKLDLELEKMGHCRSNVTLISVHVRRSDYIKYAKERYDTSVPGKEFYEAAFNYYRQRFNKSAVFAVFSDDLSWCRTMFKENDTIFPGNDTSANSKLDYIAITRCDHHIVGFGTFAFTSAFLGRGTIAYDASEDSMKFILMPKFLCHEPNEFIPIVGKKTAISIKNT